jgi:signal transduction histidine kinase
MVPPPPTTDSRSNKSVANTDLAIPLSRVATFVRQLTHDLRNGLNGIDLQAALAAELTTDPELRQEITQVRSLTGQITKSLQRLSSVFGKITLNPIDFPAEEILQDLQNRFGREFPNESKLIEWKNDLHGEIIHADFEALIAALTAVMRNAVQFREPNAELRFSTFVADAAVAFEMAETKAAVSSDPALWGVEPMISTRRGGYGLGLFGAREIVAAHNGKFDARYENGTLFTRITLPIPRQ